MKRFEWNPNLRCRILMSLAGVLLCSFSVGFFRLSRFGTDPYQCLAAGLDRLLPFGFSAVLTVLNCLLLVVVLLLGRKHVGIATVFVTFLTGGIVEWSEKLLSRTGIAETLPGRIVFLAVGLVLMCLASSLYMTPRLGVSPYDAQALMLSEGRERLFRWIRIGTDLICVTIGLLLGATVGIGTLVTALCMGPLIDWFNRKVSEPILRRSES